MKLANFTIKKIHDGLVKKEFSALEVAESFLEKIEVEDKNVSAFLKVTRDLATEGAKSVDREIAIGSDIHLLAGVPAAIKDVILMRESGTTCASKILEEYQSAYDATVIKKLKSCGAVFLGKTNMDEFAMGASTENSAFFPTKNPKDLTRVPGGSSGGSAAAVSGDMCVYALGSDTGGSIRQPAAFCGAVGLKPTYGAVSRFGLVAFASSLDQIGPIAKTVEDAKIVFEAIRGRDGLDSTSVEFKSIEDSFSPDKFKVGIPKEYFIKGMDPETKKVIDGAIKRFEELGVKIEEISLPHTQYAVPVYYLICTSEASANLARYDGIKYGLSKSGGSNLLDVYTQTREAGFGREVKRRIMLGTYSLSSGYYDAHYLKAQKVRTLIKRDFEKAFEKVDAIFSPVSPHTAFKIGEKISDPLSMYLEDIYTVSLNLAGLPGLSLPVGNANDMPVGLQIIGNYFCENKILALGQLYEENAINK